MLSGVEIWTLLMWLSRAVQIALIGAGWLGVSSGSLVKSWVLNPMPGELHFPDFLVFPALTHPL